MLNGLRPYTVSWASSTCPNRVGVFLYLRNFLFILRHSMLNCYCPPRLPPGRSRASPLRPRQGFRDVSTEEEEERQYTAGVNGRSGEKDAQAYRGIIIKNFLLSFLSKRFQKSYIFRKKVCQFIIAGCRKKYLFHLLKPKHFLSVRVRLVQVRINKCSDILQSEWGLSVLIVSQYNDSAITDILWARHLW